MAGVLDSVNQRTQLVGENRLELLLFRVNGSQLYGINVFKVREVLPCPRLTNIPKSKQVVRGIAPIRGGTISVLDLSLATGNPPLDDIESCFTVITEYNGSTQGFLVRSVERIVNLNWNEVHPPPRGTGHDHYLTAVTKVDNKLVEIIDVEKILSEVAPVNENISEGVISEEVARTAAELKVLVVDDSKIARKQVQRCVEQIGVQVTALNDGLEAWNHLMQLQDEGRSPLDEYIMMISDIEMPEMDGYTLTAEVRQHASVKGMHVVLHSSLSGVFNKAMVEKVGADDFLAKFHPDMLAEKVIERVHAVGATIPGLDE